jgi:hypothetical protein
MTRKDPTPAASADVIQLADRRARKAATVSTAGIEPDELELPSCGLRINQLAPDGTRFCYFPDPDANKRLLDALRRDFARLRWRTV